MLTSFSNRQFQFTFSTQVTITASHVTGRMLTFNKYKNITILKTGTIVLQRQLEQFQFYLKLNCNFEIRVYCFQGHWCIENVFSFDQEKELKVEQVDQLFKTP